MVCTYDVSAADPVDLVDEADDGVRRVRHVRAGRERVEAGRVHLVAVAHRQLAEGGEVAVGDGLKAKQNTVMRIPGKEHRQDIRMHKLD